MRSKSISDQGAKKTKSANRNIISPISSLELRKLKNLIKFNNYPGWDGKVATATNQHKTDQRNTYYCAKKTCILIRRQHLDMKEVKIITKSDVPEDSLE